MSKVLSREDIEPILQTISYWLSQPNIVGLSVDRKQTGGREMEDWAIVAHVIKKKPVDELDTTDFPIPKEVEMHISQPDGLYSSVMIPTDVIQSGALKEQALNKYKRPCPGGYQIQGSNIEGTGTLGVNIVWQGKYRLLSNNHVICQNGKNTTMVWQPKQSKDNSLVTLSGFIPVITYPDKNEPNPVFNQQDLAWCNITDSLGSAHISHIGLPKGIRAPKVNETVKMIGKTTGHVTHAKIKSIQLMANYHSHMGGWVWYKNLIQLDKVIGLPGDSGAALVADEDDYIVGMNMGASDTYSFGCSLFL